MPEMITDVKRERVAMTREEAITIMQLYKDELEHRIAKIDYDIREIDLYSIHLDAFEVAIEALSAEAEPTVIRCKTLLNAEDFEAVATRIRKENRNVIVIPCETEVASAEAVHKPDYSYEADMVRRLKESLSADAVQGWIPCSERLPEVGEICLLTVHEYGWNCKDYTRVIIGEYSDNYADHILAWMPLPEPYEPKTERRG